VGQLASAPRPAPNPFLLPFHPQLPIRPELRLALQSIHASPAAALAAVPVAGPPVVYRPVVPGGVVQVTAQEQQVRGRSSHLISYHIISYHIIPNHLIAYHVISPRRRAATSMQSLPGTS
jgi:hypothetical protein